jgi:hypothetical protein
MTSEKAKAKTFRLSDRLSVEITVGAGGVVCEWDPDLPKKMTANEMAGYHKAMDEMVLVVAEMIGGNVMVVEM